VKKKIVIFICIFFALLYFTTELFIDKRTARPIQMSRYTVSGFYKEPKNTLDIVSVGSSQCYTAVVPAILWRDYGWTSYDFCVEQQPFAASLYYIKEAHKRHPNAMILLEVGMNRPRSAVSDEMIFINLNDLPLSFNKVVAVIGINGEKWFDFLFTLNKYHSTWKSLNKNKIKNMFSGRWFPNKG
jgi:hypothetical protein